MDPGRWNRSDQITNVVEASTAPPGTELRSGAVSNLVGGQQVSELPLTGRSGLRVQFVSFDEAQNEAAGREGLDLPAF